jgi:hypothetical protein
MSVESNGEPTSFICTRFVSWSRLIERTRLRAGSIDIDQRNVPAIARIASHAQLDSHA